MSEQMFCPLCLNALDSHGDCWPVCEYESRFAKPEYAPLTKRQVLEKLVAKRKAYIISCKAIIKRTKLELTGYEKELERLAT